MKTTNALFLSVWLAAAAAGMARADDEKAGPSVAGVIGKLDAGAETVRVVCFGDSITGVYYHTGSRRAWTDMLGIALRKQWPRARVETINAGISGNTTAQGLARMEKDVIARRPDLVAVMFGMNDAVATPVETYAANLRRIAENCREAGAAVVFCTPNSVTENPQRPNARLAEFAAAMRRTGGDLGWPVADAFADWEALRRRDFREWTLSMSETIHPNLNGHRRFAELIASELAGKPVMLTDEDAGFARDRLSRTRARLEAGKPVKIVAMPPFDRLFAGEIRERFPDARLEVTPWPWSGAGPVQTGGDGWVAGGRAAAKGFAREIRERHPDLVVVAPPASVNAGADEALFVADAQWMLNLAFPFGREEWEVVAVLPEVAEPDPSFDPIRREILKRMMLGKDVNPLTRGEGDRRPAADLIRDTVAGEGG
ncbi:MAG: SGNH/GDSL hydrolase family protein [Verrucomicrobiae bacterium]|nr:SGNH/GDSL hydrolase family protein [Verrucomicrobiae bacterium]